MKNAIKEVVHPNDEVTLTVGKFSYRTDDQHVLVHNNAGSTPVYIRTVSYDNPDAAYKGAWRMANLQSKAGQEIYFGTA